MKSRKSKTAIIVQSFQKTDRTRNIKKGPKSRKSQKRLTGSTNQPLGRKLSSQLLQNRHRKLRTDKSLIATEVKIHGPEISEKTTTIQVTPSPLPPSYRKTLEMKEEIIWSSLANVKLRDAVDQWLESILNARTKKSYQLAMEELIVRNFLDSQWSLQQFSLISPDMVIDNIKAMPIFIRDREGNGTTKQWSMRTREARIACFLAFTRYLSRKTEGMIRRGVPSRDGIEKTFSPKPRKVKSDAMTRSQIVSFLEELDKLNPRDAMIARLCLHGGKRINEVLSLKANQIDYEKKQIIFHQSKSKFSDDFTVISFERPAALALLNELRNYIGERKELVFVTANGKGLRQNQIDRNFLKAGKRAGISFRVSPHNLRATAVTLWKEDGFNDSLIMKATGHSSSEMVHRYDKTDLADNVTRKSSLF